MKEISGINGEKLSLYLNQAPNRRVQRVMEKENKKQRSAAKRKRNEAVRVS